MHKSFLNILTATIIGSAALLIFDTEHLFAQSKPGKTDSSAIHTQSMGSQSNTQSDTSVAHNFSDDIFVTQASQSNLAEIELSKMAIDKSSSEKVREFAQMMVIHHTTAQLELSSIVSKSVAMQGDSTPDNNSNDANDETNVESDKTATSGGTGGTTGNTMAKGKTNGEFNSNRSRTDTNNSASETIAQNTGNAASSSNTMSSNSSQMGITSLATKISAEDKSIKNRLSILSGAEFEQQYIQVMVKDHAKASELFEKEALHSKNPALQAFASKMLPIIKDHYQKAQQLSK